MTIVDIKDQTNAHGSMANNCSENESHLSALKSESARQRWDMFHRAIAHAKQSNNAALQEAESPANKPKRSGPLLYDRPIEWIRAEAMECLVQYLDDLEDLFYAVALIWERIRTAVRFAVFVVTSVAFQTLGVLLALAAPPLAVATAALLMVTTALSGRRLPRVRDPRSAAEPLKIPG